jgi:hypothetical protein
MTVTRALAGSNRRLRSPLHPRQETTARDGRKTKEEKIVNISTRTQRRHVRRVAVPLLAALVIAIAATPTVVAAGDSNGQSQSGISDPYKRAHTWNTPHGQVYGPVQAGPSTYGFIGK